MGVFAFLSQDQQVASAHLQTHHQCHIELTLGLGWRIGSDTKLLTVW